ncbi:MAG: sugar phosphate isomerase/epimerase family protein [Candidatus Brocadiia bacterium]
MAASSTSRRGFLGAASAAAAGLVARPASAIEPIARTGPPRLKLSIAAYSYRQLLTRKEEPMTLDDFVETGAELGLDAVEPTSYYFRDTSPAYLRHLRAKAFRLGLDISGTAIGNDFAHPPGPARERQLDHARKWVEHAELLGAPVIRIFAGHKKKDQSDEQAYRLMVQGIEQACAYAGEHGIFLALENHGGPTTTAKDLLRFCRDVESPWFGVNLDTGNFRSPDPYDDIAAAAPYALNVQVKVALRVGGKHQPTDYRRLAGILRDAGYRGYLALEFEAREDPLTAIPRHVEALREAVAGA